MNEVTLPPSPNWYLSNVLCCAANGTVAWGARNTIVVAERQEDSKILRYSLIGNAHQDRVTCLAFSPEYGLKEKNLIISGGDEHIVRIWNLDTMRAVSSQPYMDTKQKVIGVDWSKCNPDLVCFVSRDGLLMSWTVSYNACQLYTLGKFTATCLACSPHKSNIVAIGTKSGLVYIVNLQGSGTINYKLRGHDVEITSLSWCPIEDNIFNDSRSKDMLLASGAKDRSVFVWRAGGDGRYQFNIPIPVAPMDSQQHRVKLPSSVGNWTAVCWSEPRLLLASSSWGELISWELTDLGPKSKPVCKLLHAHHTRGLFCIANVPKKSIEEENLETLSPTIIWTLAQDRQVIRSSIMEAECKIEYSVPSQGGYVYCLAACPLDTSRIAFGVGDAMLRLWNLSEPHETSFDVTSQWQKIMGKIRSIAWHPEKENLLAFGTGEGRVGIWDTNSNAKPPTLYRQYHRHTVYSLGWGPNPDDKNFVLYSCGDNELVYYPFDKPTKETKSVIKKNCTEFAWKPDFSCMAVGYEDGSISIINPSLKGIGTPIYALKKAVQCLAWHPDSTSTDSNFSPLRNYLAVAINAPTITIFDLTDFVKSTENSEEANNPEFNVENPMIRYKIIGNFTGHSEKVVTLAWSPHLSGYLISGSYDNTAQIWKIETQELIATYVEHKGPVQCCMWSPLDPDYVITGSSDFTVRVWKISEQKIVLPTESTQTKRVRTKKSKSKKATKDLTNEVPMEKLENARHSKIAEQIKVDPIVEAPKDSNGVKTKKERCKKVSHFSAYTKRMSDKSVCMKSLSALAKQVSQLQMDTTNATNGKTDENFDEKIPTIFGTLDDITMILDQEKMSHTSQGHYNMTTEMSMWNNSLRKNLQEATREKRLNDFLVSLSAGLSMKTWQETCEAYATQLLFESNHTKAISYLLSIHKIHRAVEIFIEQKMYREAYVLARYKLDKDDPILTRILNDWANTASREGNYEEVAQCYVKLGDFAKAARFLGRRKEIQILEIATEIGRFANEPGLSQSLAEQAFTESLLTGDCLAARRLVDKFSEIRHRQAQIEVFEEIKEMLENVVESTAISTWLETGMNYNLLEKLRLRCTNYTDCYGLLSQITNSSAVPENEAMLWMTTSQHLTMYAIADTREKQMCHLVSALGAISQYEIVHPKKTSVNDESFLIRFLANLEDRSPYEEESLFATNDLTVCKSLRAFLCLGLLNWLGDEKPKELINLNDVLTLIGKLLVDTIDGLTVKYWTMTNEINKLETSLATTLGKTQKADDIEGSNNDQTDLLERLNHMRSEKKRFLEERICAPSPILAYSKATQLSNILPDGNNKDSFTKTVSQAWLTAVSP